MKIYGLTPLINTLSSSDLFFIFLIICLVLVFYILKLEDENKKLLTRLSYLEGVHSKDE